MCILIVLHVAALVVLPNGINASGICILWRLVVDQCTTVYRVAWKRTRRRKMPVDVFWLAEAIELSIEIPGAYSLEKEPTYLTKSVIKYWLRAHFTAHQSSSVHRCANG